MRKLMMAVWAAALMSPVAASAEGFHPTENCVDVLTRASDTDRVLLAGWVMGYLNKQNDNPTLVRMDNARTIMQNVNDACARNRDASILELVGLSKRSNPNEAGTPAHARAFLHQFLNPGTDRAALTAKMRPTDDEIRAVYAAPLADRLIANYQQVFKPGVAIGPNPGQTEVLLWSATTESLRAGAPVLADFPGGYKEVRGLLQGRYPIFRFKFVKPGEELGMAFDGLIYINNRYVLMPKPWRALD